MWAEWVTPELIDSRIWPRTAAIAERFWSPEAVRDVPDMYRRLTIVSRRLEEAGLHHESYIDPALRRLAGDRATAEDLQVLRTFVDLLEPVKDYNRGKHQPEATQFTPLTGLVDCARPDSAAARDFSQVVDQFLAAPQESAIGKRLLPLLADWRKNAEYLLGRLPGLSPRLAEARPLLQAQFDASSASVALTLALQYGRKLTEDELARFAVATKPVTTPHAAVELPASQAFGRLLSAPHAP